MKIAFDVQLLMKGKKTGIGWCADNILEMLPRYCRNDYILNYFTMGCSNLELKNVEKYKILGYKLNKCSWFYNLAYRLIWNFIAIPYSIFFGKDADVTIFFNYAVPPGVKGKKVVFVHDMAYKAHPETVRKKTSRWLNISLEKSCRRADKIITISQFSKCEIIKYLNIKEDKIDVMPIGVNTTLFHPNYSDNNVEAVKSKYNLKNQYLLYLGTLEPRKNLIRLVEAYSELRKEVTDIPDLVLAGMKGWMYEDIFTTVVKHNLEQCVIFTGYVEDKDVPILIKGAQLFLFPSIYEGFGMPPLEAMACGTPVVSSNVSSLPEVVGDAGILIDPFSIDSIKEGIKQLILDEKLRIDLSEKGIARVKSFTWKNSIRILIDIFERL